MTELDLDAIEARANAATQGPWEVTQRPTQYGFVSEVSAPSEATTHGNLKLVPNVADSLINEDAEFIAAARTFVPAAVAELRKAHAARDRVLALHRPSYNDPDRTPLCAVCKGLKGIHECGCWADEDVVPVCAVCIGGRYKGASVDWPCQTVIDIEGETP